jgi:hypothetical protein
MDRSEIRLKFMVIPMHQDFALTGTISHLMFLLPPLYRDNCYVTRGVAQNTSGYTLSACKFDNGSSAYLDPTLGDWGLTFNESSYQKQFPRTALQYSWEVRVC